MIINPWRIFRIVFAKELRELLRDRKTLFWLFAPPIVLPTIALIAATFIGTQTARYVTNGFSVAVINSQAAPDLMQTLKHSSALIVSEVSEVEAKNGKALIILAVPDHFQQEIDAGHPAQLTLSQYDNSLPSTLALGAVRSEVAAYNNGILEQRLGKLSLNKGWLTAVTLNETQVVTAASSVTASSNSGGTSNAANTGLGALFLPLAITSWLVGGGLGLIVDTTVGEKERQTIESILVTPANRFGIVTGKLSVVFLASLFVMGLWMIEGIFLSLVGQVGPQIAAAQSSGTSIDVMALIAQSSPDLIKLISILLLLLIPFIIVLNSLVMAFCSFAGSYRESNTFLFLLQLILPAMVLLTVFAVGPDAGIGWYSAPLLGTIVAIRDLFTNTLTANGVLLAVISTSIYALAALGLASYIYSREWALMRR